MNTLDDAPFTNEMEEIGLECYGRSQTIDELSCCTLVQHCQEREGEANMDIGQQPRKKARKGNKQKYKHSASRKRILNIK